MTGGALSLQSADDVNVRKRKAMVQVGGLEKMEARRSVPALLGLLHHMSR